MCFSSGLVIDLVVHKCVPKVGVDPVINEAIFK